MTRTFERPTPRTRGFTLIGLLFWAIVISMIGLVTLRVVPTVNEYFTIRTAVQKVARTGGNTVPEIRAAFDRYTSIEYSITSVAGKDLLVSKDNDLIVIEFAYNKEIELFGSVFLLIKYSGSSR
jgi:hypothetical protein